MRYTDVCFFSLSGGYTTLYYTRYSFIRWWLVVRMIPTFRPRNSCIAICLFVGGWWYACYLCSAQETAVSLFVYSLVGVGITRTFRPWTHTSDDSYIYQLSLVVATATRSDVSERRMVMDNIVLVKSSCCPWLNPGESPIYLFYEEYI